MSPDLIEPLELDEIPLPPIPGPVSHTFFLDIPSQSPAIFSTVLGSRPIRSLLTPAPPHVVRSGTDNDIRIKAWFLLHTHPDIAEPIITAPVEWHDLYYYFDAMDLWTEGAGFLFHVLGFIVRVNLTRLNCIKSYAREWAILNDTRLTSMPVLYPEILKSVFTPEDQAWFDLDNLTRYEGETLCAVLNSYLATPQTTKAPLRPVRLEGAEQMARQAHRPANTLLPGPYQHFGPSGQIANGSPPKKSTTSESCYHISNSTRSYGSSRAPLIEIAPRTTETPWLGTTDSRLIYVDSRVDFTNGPRQSPPNGHPLNMTQAHPYPHTGPLYVFNASKTAIDPRSGMLPASAHQRFWPPTLHPAYQRQHHSRPVNKPEDRLVHKECSKGVKGSPNDARLFYPMEPDRNHIETTRRSMPSARKQSVGQTSWPMVKRNQDCVVFVGGLEEEMLITEWVPKLLSGCGEIVYFKVLHTKACCFVTFKDPSSAEQAIVRFHRYEFEEGRFLTVQYPRSRPETGVHENQDGSQNRLRARSQNWPRDGPIATSRHADGSAYQIFGQPESVVMLQDGLPPCFHTNTPHSMAVPPQNGTESTSQGKFLGAGDYGGNMRHFALEQRLALRNDVVLSASFHSQSQHVKSLAETPDRKQYPLIFEETADPVDEDQTGDSGPKLPERPKKSVSSRNKRKNKNKSVSSNGTPTHTPVRKSASVSPKANLKVDRLEDDSSAIHLTKSTHAQQINITEFNFNTEEVQSTDKLSRAPNDPKSVVLSEGQCKKQITSASYKNAIAIPYKKANNSGKQKLNLGSPAEINQLSGSSEGVLVEALKVGFSELSKIPKSLPQSVGASDLTNILQTKPTFHKNSHSRRRPGPSKSGNTEVSVAIPTSLKEEIPVQASPSKIPEVLHLETERRAIPSSVATSQVIPSPNGESEPRAENNGERQAPLISTTPGRCTASEGRGSPIRNQGKRIIQNKINARDDIFDDNTAKANHKPQNSDASTHSNADEGNLTKSSTRKAEKRENKNHNGSPTPTGKSQYRSKKTSIDKKVDRKENLEPPTSLTQILADPSHWPALGSGKEQPEIKPSNLQINTSLVRPLSERTPKTEPIRRDSMASVISAPSPSRPTRRPTVNIVSSPDSGGSPSWPVVKRWDSYVVLPEGSGESASTAAGTK